MVRIFTYILGFLLLLGCQKNNPKVTLTKTFDTFEEIHLNSPFDVQLQEDSTFYIEIIANQKTIEAITFDLSNGVLKIENELSGRFLKPNTNKVTLVIHSKPLKLLQANETCFISTVNPITSLDFGLIMKSKGNFAELELNSKVFYFWNNYPCGGKLTLTGTTEQLKIWSSAIFSVDAKNLVTQYAFVENNSKGNCEVNVSSALEYNIRSEGNIGVYGNPVTIVENGNSGDGAFILY